MSEFLAEPGAAVEAQPEAETHAESGALTVSADDFSALEERILRAVEMVKRERRERAAAEELAVHAETRAAQAEERAVRAEERATHAEAAAAKAGEKLEEQIPVVDGMQSELNALRSERDHVRVRVERLLKQLDGLEL